MNETARRLVLALALVFAAPFFGVQCYVFLDYGGGWYLDAATEVSIALTATLFAVCWWLIWWGCVVWTRTRVVRTVFLTGAAVALAVLIAWLNDMRDGDWIFGATLSGAAWIAGTAWLWGAPDARRRSASGVHVRCRKCGYDLRGLHEARCPECGTQYTLDELVADATEDTHGDE